ncbi:MAG: hypothetical protein IPM08_04830 [Actinomycetales bacterium]|nr:hypothetical protein [Actinomycetales bacterium]
MIRRAWRLLLAGVVCFSAVSGCLGLPSSSVVSVGRGIDEQVAPEARIVVPAPAPGADPDGIVRGFLRAGAAFQEAPEGGSPVGTAYLAAASVDRWRPTSSVTVFDRMSVVEVSMVGTDRVRASVVAVSVIDELGRYRELPPNTVVSVEFGLVAVGNEWRILLPENGFGIWINTDDFSRVFAPYRLNYVGIGTRFLVPDVRWLPNGPRLVTALARAQLGPVPEQLRGACETGFPEGAKLALDAVSVTDGIATVVLTPIASTADALSRREMWAQLASTLLAVPGVMGVTLEVQGSGRLAVEEVTGALRGARDLGYAVDPTWTSSTALVRVGEELRMVDMTRLGQVGDVKVNPIASDLPAVPTTMSAVAWAADGVGLAALDAQGSVLVRWRGKSQIAVPPFATGLTRPAFDALGRLWVAGLADGRSSLWTLNGLAAQSVSADRIDPAWLAGRTVVAVAPSPDATRLAVVSRGADGIDRLDIAGIVKDTTGLPKGLTMPQRVGEPLTRVLDTVWMDTATVAALGAVSTADPVRPFVVEFGQGIGLRRRGTVGPEDNLVPPPTSPRWVVSTGGPRGLVVVTDLPAVLVRVGGGWLRLAGADELVVPPVH